MAGIRVSTDAGFVYLNILTDNCNPREPREWENINGPGERRKNLRRKKKGRKGKNGDREI